MQCLHFCAFPPSVEAFDKIRPPHSRGRLRLQAASCAAVSFKTVYDELLTTAAEEPSTETLSEGLASICAATCSLSAARIAMSSLAEAESSWLPTAPSWRL
jgi:hypothetical protein